MSEEFLSGLHINDLIDLMASSIEELLMLNKISYNKLAVELKQKEVELIQKVIVVRRMEFPPR